jgi:hypothetical protein
MRWLIVLTLFFGGINANSQRSSQFGFSIPDEDCPEFNFLGNTQQFKKSLLIASNSFYELKGITIDVKRKNIKTLMAARPKANFLFRKNKNREYVILISKKQNMNARVLYMQMSNRALIGVLGHELSHIVCYSQKSNLEMIFFGIKYVFNKKEIEVDTDIMAINKGFGKQILEFNQYIHHSSRTNKKYLRKKNRYYLSSNEIEQKILESL